MHNSFIVYRIKRDVWAVRKVGLNQLEEVSEKVFVDLPQYYDMFVRRLDILRRSV